MEFKKNDLVQVTIEDMSHEGAGIGKADGYTLFMEQKNKRLKSKQKS